MEVSCGGNGTIHIVPLDTIDIAPPGGNPCIEMGSRMIWCPGDWGSPINQGVDFVSVRCNTNLGGAVDDLVLTVSLSEGETPLECDKCLDPTWNPPRCTMVGGSAFIGLAISTFCSDQMVFLDETCTGTVEVLTVDFMDLPFCLGRTECYVPIADEDSRDPCDALLPSVEVTTTGPGLGCIDYF